MRPGLGLALLAAVALLAGCGKAQRPGDRIRGQVLTIYFSGPMHGGSSVQSQAALNGARLALAQARSRIGHYRIRLRALDDSTPQSLGWDPSQTTLDARLAAQDPTTIGYLGDYNSGASAISIPILNRLGIVQVSPGSSAVGLTTAGPGAAPGEPQKYYPTGIRSFARVVPTDAGQALALVRAEQAIGCRTTVVLEDSEVDGEDAALTYLLTAQSAGLRVVAVQAFQPQATNYLGLARSLASSGADCIVLSAIHEASSVSLTERVARALPHATILATGPLADGAYVDPALGGLPAGLDPRVILVSASLTSAPGSSSARRFLAAYARRFGPAPPGAVFGYEAMSVLLAAIRHATDNGHRPAERSKVRAEVFSDRRIDGPLGTFRIDANGDTSIHGYATYKLTAGRLIPWPTAGR